MLSMQQATAASSSQASATWTDLFQEAPALLELLPSKSLAAVLATSKTHRNQVHTATPFIAVPKSKDIPDLLTGWWPKLRAWTAEELLEPISLADSANVKCHLSMTGQNLGTDAICRLSKGIFVQLHELSLTFCNLDAECIFHLINGKWPDIQKLNLRGNHLEATAIANLAQAEWQKLKHLDLSQNRLDAAAVSALTKGAWPDLAYLRLSGNGLSACTTLLRLQGQWKSLNYLIVTDNLVNVLQL